MATNIQKYVLLAFFSFGSLLSFPATAAEVTFHAANSGQEMHLLETYFTPQKSIPADTTISSVDLNEDGINEYILRNACNPGPCRFTILADGDSGPLSLGELKGFNLALGNAYSSGVRNIIAYPDKVNDFNSVIYIWEPEVSRYMIKNN